MSWQLAVKGRISKHFVTRYIFTKGDDLMPVVLSSELQEMITLDEVFSLNALGYVFNCNDGKAISFEKERGM